MGNDCSFYNVNQVCLGRDLNIKIDSFEEQEKKNGNNSSINSINKDENQELNRFVTFSDNNKIKTQKNSPSNKEDIKGKKLSAAQLNLLSNIDKAKGEEIKKTQTIGFTNFMQDFTDISFNNFGEVDKNDIFENNYIAIKYNYNEEMNNYLNKVRNDPNSIIEDIDDLLNDDNIFQNQKIKIENEDTHENIIFNDEGNALKELKIYLNKVDSIPNKFNINDDLSIDTSELEKYNDLTLNKKITKILLDKRKSLIKDYPNCKFFINFIKDPKISILYLLSENGDKSDFWNVIFDPKFTEFNVTWIKEKKKIFIAYLCFA